MMELEVIIGLEVHAQVNTKTKMFCGCSTSAWGKPPNSLICPICMGHPGSLPVPNRAVIEKAIRASKALGCTVNKDCHFDRKNYFYPDLPCGYQISQYKHPLASNGLVRFSVSDHGTNAVSDGECRILRLHIENDAGKLTHRGSVSLCDYNRAGTPLMEIVTEPDLRSPREASAFAEELRRILIAVGSSEADMFKGMMRFDASISLRPMGDTKLYPRVEIKNLNSFKSLERALTYQEKILRDLWASGKQPTGETTVGWIDDDGRTEVLRDKESAADYRYFPEPDIPPLHCSEAFIEESTRGGITLPSERKAAYRTLGLTEAEAVLLVDDPELQERFDAIYETLNDGKRASSIVLSQLRGFLTKHEKSFAEGPSVQNLVELANFLKSGTISTNTGKEVLEEMVKTGDSSASIVERKGLTTVSDDATLQALVTQALAEHPQAIEAFKKGKTQALGAIVGAVMKQTKGQADAAKVQALVRSSVA